jgi:hypothetical protein
MDGPVGRIRKKVLELYIREAFENDRETFLEAHKGSDFLVSHGSIKEARQQGDEDMGYLTVPGGGMDELEERLHGEGTCVYEIPWDNIDWNAEAFRMGKVWIGRAPNVAIIVPNRAVSKGHGFIRKRRDEVVYGDMGSKFGSRVNGRNVRPGGEGVPLVSGSVISLAKVVEFTFYSAEDFYANVLEHSA